MNDSKNAEERAAKYMDIAKISQEQLWKRRQIEWRTSFGLWTAMGVGAGFAYMKVNRPIPDFIRLPMIICAIVVYGIAIYLHIRHMRAIFISNEMDLDIMNYNTNRAAWELDQDVMEKPQLPTWVKKERDKSWRDGYYEEKKDKMTYLYTSVGITCLIAILSIGLFVIMAKETQTVSQEVKKNEISIHGTSIETEGKLKIN